jgi:hypothetical protein
MRRVSVALAALALLLGGGVGQVKAGPITTLFDTGVDASGTPLADSTVGDPHYSLVSVPAGSVSQLLVRTSAGGFPIPPYFGNDSLSDWIGPNNDHSLDGPVGLYDYRTTFSLAGFNPATASITGGWSSDNDGRQILLNGVDTGNPPTSFTQFSSGFASFSVSSGFLPGVNTLDFIVSNGGGPTALRVEMSGTASSAAVPEPATLTLLGIGAVSLVGYGWRKRKAAQP